MSDVNANINISIDSSKALGQLRALQDQISNFNKSVIAGNVAAAQAQKDLTRNLSAQINATKQFTTSITNVESSVSRLGKAIDNNKLSLREYFRYGIASSGAFGKSMREHASIMELAGERVKRLQTQYIALEQAHNGYTRSMAVRPTNLFNADSAIAIQRQQIFNKLLHDGSTALVNWGKNTQWAGRQLMVGFTVPLTIFGGVAGKIFMDLEKQVVQFKRVYGDLTTSTGERNAMVEEVKAMGKEFTKYGITVADTVALAAKAAATGATGADLIAQTTEATRLATLGQIDYQQALDATISLQTAFGTSSKDLADATNFLNAVENQTVTSLDDITQAIPLVAPVIKGLGGDVKDLAIFMTAMREGGISANEGANALKSGLASLINPTKAAREQLAAVGINIDAILSKNKGDLRGLVTEFGAALGTLGKFERQQTLAKMFGKYQFARLGALFANISKDGSQASRVIDLTAMSTKELGQIAEGELGQLEQAVGVKFTAAVEKLKLAIAPIGEAFLKIATPIIEWVTKIADKFNELPDAAKTFITWGAAIGGVLVPTIIMLVGLLGNFAGNMLKIGAAIGRLMGKTNGLSSGLEYLTMEELDAMAASESLEAQTNSLTGALNVQSKAVARLAAAYGSYVAAAGAAAANLPQGFRGPATRMATGGFVAGSGNKDSEPALLMPGEFVVNKEAAQKYGSILSAMNAGTIKGYSLGSEPTARTHLTPALGISIAEALQLEGITDGIRRKLSLLQEMSDALGDDLVVNITRVSNLVAEMPERFNLAMRDGLPQADFVKDFSEAGIDKWRLTADVAGQGENFDALTPHLQILDEKILEASREFAIVGDSNIGTIVERAFAALPQESRDMLAGIEALSTQFNNLRITVGALEDEVAQRLFDQTGIEYSRGTGESSSRLTFTRGGEVVGTARTQQETSSFGPNYRRSPLNFSGTRAAALDQAHAAAAQAGEASGVAYWTAFATSLRESGKNASQILAAALAEGMDPEIAMEALGSSFTRTHTLEKAMRDMGLMAGAEIGPAVLEGASAASPPPWSTDLGKWIGQGIKGAMRVELSDVGNIVSSALKNAGQGSGGIGPIASVLNLKQQQKENAEAKERAAIEAEINSEISKRAMILQRQGIPAQAALDRARKEVLAKREQLVVEQQILEVEQKQSQAPVVPPNAKMLPIVPSGAGGTEGGNQSNIIARGSRAFGQALIKGSAKITGAMFALDGLVFGLSMMDNGIGEFAQKIMPVVFGLQGLQMVLPLLMNPVGGTIAALVAVSAGLWILNKQADDVRARGKQLADAMYGTTKSMNDTAAFFERKTWDQKLVQSQIQQETGDKQTPETTQKAQSYLESDAGKTLFENVKATLDTLGSEKAATALKNNLERMMLSGAIAPEMGSAIAVQIADQLGNKKIAIDAVTEITKVIGPNGENLKSLDNRLKIAADIVGDMSDLSSAFEKAGLIWDGSSWLAQVTMIVKGQGTADIFADTAAQESINKLTVYQNELDRVETKWNDGKLSAKDYQNQVSAIFDQKQLVSYQGMLDQANKLYGEEFGATQINSMGQTLVNSLMNNINASLGEKAGKNFLDGLQSTVSDGFDTWDVNLLNPDQVSSSIEVLLSEGQKAVADTLQQQYDAVMNLSLQISSGAVDPSTIENLLSNGLEPVDIVAKLAVQYEDPTAAAIYSMALGALKPDDVLFNAVINYLDNGMTGEAGKIVDMALRGERVGVNVDMEFTSLGSSIQDIETRISQVEEFDALAAKKRTPIKEIVTFASENYGLVTSQIDNWDKLNASEKKKRVMFYVDAYLQLRQTFTDTGALEDAMAGLGGAGSYVVDAMGDRSGVLDSMVSSAAAAQTNDEFSGKRKGGGAPPPETPSGGGGGGAEQKKETPLKDWLKGLVRQIQLYDDMKFTYDKLMNSKKALWKTLKVNRGLDDQLLKAGYSRSFVDLIMQQDPKIAQSFLSKKKGYIGKGGEITKKGKKAEKIGLLDIGGQGRIDVAGRITEKQNLTKGRGILQEMGVSPDVIKAFGEDSQIMNSIVALKSAGKAGKKELQDLINKLVELQKLEQNPVDIAIEKLTKEHDDVVKKIEEEIKGYEDQIDAINEQINAIQKLNDADQERIDSLNRQKEMIQRQIDVLERANEMDQRKIDALQREDEMRQRIASTIQHDLEQLSRSEEEIRNSYQKRMEALDKIAQLNERILQSQQDQLNVSKALSEGDIYAAAQAAAQMQQNQVQYAAQANRDALQQGMENQVSGLRTAGGLTREQAEAQLAAIQEQSYQTQLQIQVIQDKIYQRNLDMLPLKDAQYALDIQMRDIQDVMYARQLEIDALEKNITPLEDKIKANQKVKEKIDEQFTAQVDQLELQRDNLGATQEQINAADALAKQWREVAKQIKNANDLADRRTNELGGPPDKQKFDKVEEWRAAYADWQAKRDKIVADRNATVNEAYSTVKKYAGGKIKKYATGALLGSGARDSIPAMLTPGEFVVRKSMVEKYGASMLQDINQGSFSMPKYRGAAPMVGAAPKVNAAVTNHVAPVYNTYSVSVNATTNANPEELANTVINKIRSIESMSVRRVNGY